MSHTPGPWRLTRDEADRQKFGMPVDYWNIDAGAGFATGNNGFGLTGWMPEADARLIAAAPELLEALKATIANHCGNEALFCSTCSPAREIIKKAEGAQ